MQLSADRKFMKRAIGLGRIGLGLASPNPSVGCVIVRRGKIVGQGWHEYSMKDHAEVRALQAAGGKSRGATAYVTLEPCSHQGRTPPCADKLIKAGIKRVVVGRIDPNPVVSGKGIAILKAAGLSVDCGLMHKECSELIEPFARHITSGTPLVVSKVGMSLDGRIGTYRGESRWITSPKGREFGQGLRLQADAILVGVGTILADDPELTYRGRQEKAKPLLRVVLDSKLRSPANARIFSAPLQAPVLVFCAENAPPARREKLENRGAEVIMSPKNVNGLDLGFILGELGRRNVLSVLVEGGSEVHWSFLVARLVDKFYSIIAPLVIGGRRAVASVGGKGYGTISEAPRFKISKRYFAGPDLILESYPIYSRSILSPWLLPETPPCVAPGFVQSSGQK
jgi:diaminohydroxyphosphoribosylaminopyrimidine deaminase / 5-amino-6-(5-phosphoribosylamino)uracil reductase